MDIVGLLFSLVIVVLIGAGVLYFMMNKLLQSEKSERADDRSQYEKKISSLETEKNASLDKAKEEAEKLIVRAKEDEEKRRKEEIADLRNLYQDQIDTLKANLQTAAKKLDEARENADRDMTRAKEEDDRRRKEELSDLKKSYQEQIDTLKSNLQATTENLLKQRSSDLQEENNKQVSSLLAPLQENIKKMEQAIALNNEQSARNSQSFTEQMKSMMESSQSLSSQAERLSNALQRDNKVVGNWGELILSELLESQGLVNGKHYDLQATIRDDSGNVLTNEESGKRMIPDAILHLADNRDVVIDSKMSLTAFIDYQNADTEEQRKEALARHLKSVKSHVKELKDKDYSSYFKGQRKSCGFVMMFIPIEGALQLAISEDKDLWRNAFEDKVFIVGAQTLMAALRIIDLTWVNVQQQKNINEILKTAGQLIDRVSRFHSSFADVKKKLDSLSDSYDKVVNSVDGKQGILSSGRKLELLGVRGSKSLPKSDIDEGINIVEGEAEE